MGREFISDKSGTAYGLGILVIFLVSCSSMFIVYIPVINAFIGAYNDQVDDGYVSEQRGDSMDFLLLLWRGLPIWSFFALIAWGVVRALEQKSAEVG